MHIFESCLLPGKGRIEYFHKCVGTNTVMAAISHLHTLHTTLLRAAVLRVQDYRKHKEGILKKYHTIYRTPRIVHKLSIPFKVAVPFYNGTFSFLFQGQKKLL